MGLGTNINTYMESTPEDLRFARRIFSQKVIWGPKMARDSVLYTRALFFGLQIQAFEEVPRGIVKVFLCSFYFRSHFFLKSRMRSKPS